MVNKKNINPQGTPPDGMFDWPQPEFEQLYNDAMDASFAALARDVIIHLPPEKSMSSGLMNANIPAMQYNPFAGRAPRPAPNIISTTKEPAVEFVHRDVTYKAHIRHGPIAKDESGGVALEQGQVQLTTVVESLVHLKNAESVTVDGLRYKSETIRHIGLQQTRYIISVWTRINEQQDG